MRLGSSLMGTVRERARETSLDVRDLSNYLTNKYLGI